MTPIEPRHDVAFYADWPRLDECVFQYSFDGLLAEETIVLILSGRSLQMVSTVLSDHGLDIAELVETGRFALFDADDTLAKIDGPSGVDWAAVTSLANDLVDTASSSGRPVRLFGEMVTMLWNHDRVTEALELERFWHELSGRRRLDVLCAYPSFIAPGVVEPMNLLCGLHDHVVSIRDGRQQLDVSWYPADTLSVRQARHHVHALLAPVAQRHALVDVDLIVSELAANAVQHARTPFSVEVSQAGAIARVSVRDGHPAVPVLRHSSASAVGGRGLALIESLADSWGVSATPAGKEVWATIALY